MTEPAPFKPHRGLLIFFSILLALWIAGMLTMYFKTVYPHRHGSPEHSIQPK